ncbi:MAG: DNA polymerase III subunit delta' [Candidatus Contendobacter sp.]|nr:DNA polymerase III subunit delta' [Candidatus Contendobacter sp.]MDG4556751.1 DNA polymerase III subunit delta' [Candidatus Contendobacter sp.]
MDDERLPWHRDLWRRWRERRAAGRLPHALLLSGPAGLGKGLFARRLARALLCDRPDAEGEACGQCRSCRLFRAGSHPDHSVVRPEEDGKIIKVDQIRELRVFLGYTAQYGGYKIALLEPADRLNVNAANALLKTLEEPPGNGLLLLVTAQPARLPATVRSRCQRIDFDPPAAAVAVPWLAARVADGLDPAVLLDIAGGGPLAALAQAGDERWRRRRELLECYEQALAGRIDPIRAAERWTQGDLSENLGWLVGWHTDLIRLKMSAEPPRLSHPDLRSALRRWAGRGTPRVLFGRLDAAVRLRALCATTQVNAPLLLEAFLGDALL